MTAKDNYTMKDNECYCLSCSEVFEEGELEQHLQIHRERNENCAIRYSDGATIIHILHENKCTE